MTETKENSISSNADDDDGLLNIISNNHETSKTNNMTTTTTTTTTRTTTRELMISQFSKDKNNHHQQQQHLQQQQRQQQQQHSINPVSSQNSEGIIGVQKVYKKTSMNSAVTLYLPTRELILNGSHPANIKGIVYVDPTQIQGYHRLYTQLTLTFRYGREDEEVMGLRFCNEAIMSLQQLWPPIETSDDPTTTPPILTPLQEALLKRLGEGAYPFSLSLTANAPPSVQLVPAKHYHGAPIGTSYDVRCFIGDQIDNSFHKTISVKMTVRVIYRLNMSTPNMVGIANCSTFVDNPISPTSKTEANNIENTDNKQPAIKNELLNTAACNCDASSSNVNNILALAAHTNEDRNRKNDRLDAFAKLRSSPKAFRLSGRFGRSKSDTEKCFIAALRNYSKSFQECELSADGNGPYGKVDKPFLLQDGRVVLKAGLNKAWYAHGEDIYITVNICNDSRKTVRKIRVCAIQHVDVCMFNNGKFKNVVADTDIQSPVDRVVGPGAKFDTTVTLKPQRGTTKNWIALEDSLQRSTVPEEIIGTIAASAMRTPLFQTHSEQEVASYAGGSGICIPHPNRNDDKVPTSNSTNALNERNIFAIYVSYYIKVKLTLSAMGGELSLKLPFALVHVENGQTSPDDLLNQMNNLTLNKVPNNRQAIFSRKENSQESKDETKFELIDNNSKDLPLNSGNNIGLHSINNKRRPLLRGVTTAIDLEQHNDIEADCLHPVMVKQQSIQQIVHVAEVHSK